MTASSSSVMSAIASSEWWSVAIMRRLLLTVKFQQRYEKRHGNGVKTRKCLNCPVRQTPTGHLRGRAIVSSPLIHALTQIDEHTPGRSRLSG